MTAEPARSGEVIGRARTTRALSVDAVLALAAFAAVVAYLAAMPLNIQGPDEARHLDHAKRILDGDVLYRDVFDITTPGWVLVMSAAFSLFGTTLAVARGVNAVIQGLIAATTFMLCRRIGVRRALAVACALASLIPHQVFFGASYHWLASLLSLLVLLVAMRGVPTTARAFAIGAMLGLLTAVHQQRGAVVGVGIGTWLALQWLVDRWNGLRAAPGALLRHLVAVAAGALVILVPLLALMVWWAGVGPVWECLIHVPLAGYRRALRTRWGQNWGMKNAAAELVRRAVVALLPMAAVTAVLAWRRPTSEAARQHLLLTVFGLASLLSIAYFPDVVHLAVIASVFFIMIADLIERGLRLVPPRSNHVLGVVVAGAVMLGIAVMSYERLAVMRRAHAFPYESAFGRIDLPNVFGRVPIDPAPVAEHYDQLRALVKTIPGHVLYVHNRASYMNLLLGARNPTRYDLVLPPTFTTDDQMREIIASLRDKQVPYIIWTGRPDRRDLVAQYILDHYEQEPDPMPLARSLWRLKAPGAGPTDEASPAPDTQ